MAARALTFKAKNNRFPKPIDKARLQKPRLILFLPPVKHLRLLWRLFFSISFTTVIVVEIWLRRTFAGADTRTAMKVRRRWARKLLRGIGVQFEHEGIAPDLPCILVSNHRSYLDPILMLCHVNAYPVAKAELADWPVIGKGAKLAGILYLRREHSGSRANALRLMEEKLKEGFPIIIFPEGTTSGEPGTLPFKKGVFQLAARINFPIVPVAVIFPDPRDFWTGTESFGSHAGRRFLEKTIAAKVVYGQPLQGNDPDVLMAEAKKWIESRLLQP